MANNKMTRFQVNRAVYQLQKSTNYDNDFTLLYKMELHLMQKRVFNKITFQYDEDFKGECQLYGYDILHEVLLECVAEYNFNSGTDFSTFFFVRARNAVVSEIRSSHFKQWKQMKVDPKSIKSTADFSVEEETNDEADNAADDYVVDNNALGKIQQKYDLEAKESELAKLLIDNYNKPYKDLLIREKMNLPTRTYFRLKNKLTQKLPHPRKTNLSK